MTNHERPRLGDAARYVEDSATRLVPDCLRGLVEVKLIRIYAGDDDKLAEFEGDAWFLAKKLQPWNGHPLFKVTSGQIVGVSATLLETIRDNSLPLKGSVDFSTDVPMAHQALESAGYCEVQETTRQGQTFSIMTKTDQVSQVAARFPAPLNTGFSIPPVERA